eukprot:8213582-Pyramimonas_sp.AAC.1
MRRHVNWSDARSQIYYVLVRSTTYSYWPTLKSTLIVSEGRALRDARAHLAGPCGPLLAGAVDELERQVAGAGGGESAEQRPLQREGKRL